MSFSTPAGQIPELTAAILAGGESSRMGQDKALVRLDDQGPTLLEATIATLSRIAVRVIVIAPEERSYGKFGVEIVPDGFPGMGVLGGITTGLLAVGSGKLFVVACDHPFLSEALIRHLASIEGEYDAVVPRTRGRSRQGGNLIVQTLHAVYRPSNLPVLRDVLDRGYESTMDFFNRVNLRTIDEPELRRFDPELRSLMSVNTPETLEEARAMARKMAKRTVPVDYTYESNS